MRNKFLGIFILIVTIVIGILIGHSFTVYQFRKRAPFFLKRKFVEHQRKEFVQMMKPIVEKGARDRFFLKKAIIDRDTLKIDSLIEVVSQDEKEIITQVTHHLLIITKDLPERDRGRLINVLLTPHLRGKKRRFR